MDRIIITRLAVALVGADEPVAFRSLTWFEATEFNLASKRSVVELERVLQGDAIKNLVRPNHGPNAFLFWSRLAHRMPQ